MPYLPIERYGVIGDMHTAALVGDDGSIDWCCLPKFDAPSVFGRILDDTKGGFFQVSIADSISSKQLYLPDTNVLITRFHNHDGVAQVVDFMPIARTRNHQPMIVRRVEVIRGTVRLNVRCRPAFDYARARHTIRSRPGGVRFESSSGQVLHLGLAYDYRVEDEGVVADPVLHRGDMATFTVALADPTDDLTPLSRGQADRLFSQTLDYWRDWLRTCHYQGRWREMVNRSALALKLLTYAPTGAIIAAPTTSLPEEIGGGRNWDYRYNWIRDSAFILYGFMRIGLTSEADAFMGFLEQRLKEPHSNGEPLQVMYAIDGSHDITEEELPHLAGYRDSKPVRIGNAAYQQKQLDIHGELMDSIYLYNKYSNLVPYDLWTDIQRLMDWLGDHWQEADAGIWEPRGGHAQLTHSKLMCWVAFDRALRLADKRSFPAPRARWLATRDDIYETIMTRGWNPRRKAFVGTLDGKNLDAATLMMPLTFFIAPTDPRMTATIDAIVKELTVDSLVLRYNVEERKDGLEGSEGTFSMCSFWLAEALARAGRLDEAQLLFGRMLGYANHLGLYSEEIGPTGESIGNFPQGFTHLGLISAAFNLDRALNE